MRIHTIQAQPRHLQGWKRDKVDIRDKLLPDQVIHPGPLPPAVDLSSQCSAIEDQGQLGSCTANASVSMMESLYKKIGKPYPQLSRLFLYYVTRVEVEGTPASEDSGAELRDVMKALAKYGTCPEALWPYDITKFGYAPPARAVVAAQDHKITRYLSVVGMTAIKSALAAGYPFVFGFSVPENMMSAECALTGIVQYPGPDESIVGGHAVLAMGYNDTTQLIEFDNSWGKVWGNQGHGYLPYAFFDNDLASDCWVLYNEQMR